MFKKLNFESIEDLIKTFKRNKNIIGIIQCGSRNYLNENINEIGDYDLTVIIDQNISNNIMGLHFFIKKIPVDCMIKTIDQFYKPITNVFDLMHLDGVIIHDTNNEVQKALNYFIEHSNHNRLFDNKLVINKYRYKFTHIKYKLLKRLNKNDLTIKYLFNVGFITFVEFYMITRKIQPGKFKLAFEMMQTNESELFTLVKRYQNTNDEQVMYELIEKIFSYMLKFCNGFWKEDEILFRKNIDSNLEDENKLLEFLFDK
ncbi:hypothetical protein [Mesoplasma syrphidae]|uniref:hypothetical protein n=1 Tax=Mesoplasma syrphidae TaxID=225999 RepID=UPI00047A3BDD|nr:hypothetical protein [Mesoplasma syrphidae]